MDDDFELHPQQDDRYRDYWSSSYHYAGEYVSVTSPAVVRTNNTVIAALMV